LKVRPQINADVEKNLRAALNRDPVLEGSKIEAAVINHVAYLGGWVDSELQRLEAQDVASRTKGVVEVRNHLKFEPSVSFPFYSWPYVASERYLPLPPRSDQQIEKDIEKAFFWSPFVDRDDIKLSVHDGVAILTGKVDGWLAYGEADRDARKSGATDVINRLQVKKGAWF